LRFGNRNRSPFWDYDARVGRNVALPASLSGATALTKGRMDGFIYAVHRLSIDTTKSLAESGSVNRADLCAVGDLRDNEACGIPRGASGFRIAGR
jgi:hypothetical protein